MGLSFELEPGSTVSENNTKSNTNIVTMDAIEDETVIAIAPNIKGPNAINAYQVQNDVSVADEAEREEGEIDNSDDGDDAIGFEYEAISSDEEFTLRQKIEALEARNLELEKIASISARSQDAYDVGYGYKNYKAPAPSSNRTNLCKPLPLSSQPHFTNFNSVRGLQNISSDDSPTDQSDIESKYSRSYKSSKKQRYHSRYSEGEREKDRCRLHGKRRCCENNGNGIDLIEVPANERKKEKRQKSKYNERISRTKSSNKNNQFQQYSTSDDDCVETTNREELKVALNIKEISKEFTKSTLSHKLKAIRNKSLQNMKRRTGKKKSRTKMRERNTSNVSYDSLETTKENIIAAIANENIAIDSDGIEGEDDADNCDEAISLEEQELRLIALKSAVLKKHEARKKRQLALSVRPYSPTDSLLTPLADDTADQNNSIDIVESDNNNMDISPASSPNSNRCQPMDMELASSNDDSKSPVFFYGKSAFQPSEHYMNWMCMPPNALPNNPMCLEIETIPFHGTIPLKQNQIIPNKFVETPDRDFNLESQKNTSSENIEENELRAQLIANLKTTRNAEQSITEIKLNSNKSIIEKNAEEEINNLDESLEADCLRSLLLSSIKQKKTASVKRHSATIKSIETMPKVAKTANSCFNQTDDSLNMPKIASNLREALKRLQHKQTNKNEDVNSTLNNEIQMKPCKLEHKTGILLGSFLSTDGNVNNKASDNQLELAGVPNKKEIIISDTIEVLPIIATTEKLATTKSIATELIKTKISEINKPTSIQLNSKITKKILSTTATASATSIAVNSQKISGNNQASKLVAKQSPQNMNLTNQMPLKKYTQIPIPPTAVMPNRTQTKIDPKILSNAVPFAAIRTINKLIKKLPVGAPTIIAPLAKKQQFTPISISPKTEIVKRSTLIPDWKPVQKLIINLNDTDSTTDYDDDDDDNVDDDVNGAPDSTTYANSISKLSMDAMRDFDNASPASILMDSPTFAPSSPINTENTSEVTATNEADESEPTTSDTKSSFQMKLDEYLKNVRAKIDAKPSPSITKLNDVATPANPVKKNMISLKPKTPIAVCHLPISSQLEYRRLINRIKLLEKQKEQKSRLMIKQQQQPQQKLIPVTSHGASVDDLTFPSITVTLQNENRFIQTIESPKDQRMPTSPLTTTSSTILKSCDSLKKKVLVKNTLNNLTAANASISADNKNSVDLREKLDTMLSVSIDQSPELDKSIVDPSSSLLAIVSQEKKSIEALSTSSDSQLPSTSILDDKSIDERIEILKTTEKQFVNHSTKFIDDLEVMHQLVCRALTETKKQMNLEQELEQLRSKCHMIEEELTRQKSVTLNMFPKIAEKQKTITEKRSISTKIMTYCNQLGGKLFGENYKLCCDNEDIIKDKIQFILQETKKLKMLKGTMPWLSPNEESTHLHETSSRSETEVSDMPTISAIPQTIIDQPIITKNPPDRSLLTESKSTANNSDGININDESLMICVENDLLANQQQQVHCTISPHSVGEFLTDTNLIRKDDDGTCGRYRSPLDHMQNNTVQDIGQRLTDRNAIICPFDLMGRCEDKQCSYQHLSS